MKFLENPDYANFWKATFCSLGFFLLQISTNTVQQVQSQAFDDNGYGGLGFFMLGLSYGSLGICCLFAPFILDKIGPKKCMVAGSIFDTLWILAQMAPALKQKNPDSDSFFYSSGFIIFSNAFAAITSGIGSSLLWVAEGKYISDCATEKSKGFFFGYFWAFYMASQVFGNLIAALVFQSFDLIAFYFVMAGFSIISGIVFSLLQKPKITRIEQDQVAIPPILKEANNTQEHSNYDTIPYEYQEVKFQSRIKKSIKQVFEMMVSKRMRYLLPEMIWTGISLSIYTGLLIPMIVQTMDGEDQNSKLMKSMFAMVSFGIGEIFGSLATGYLIDKQGNKATSGLTLIMIVIQTLVTILFLESNTYGQVRHIIIFCRILAFIMTFMWGVADATVNIHLQELLGFEFEDNVRPYSILNFVQSITIFFFLVAEAFVKTHTQYYVFHIVCSILALLMCSVTFKFPFKDQFQQYNIMYEQKQNEKSKESPKEEGQE